MKRIIYLSLASILALGVMASCNERGSTLPSKKFEMIEKLPMEPDGIVRLSKIEVYPEYLDEYMKFAVEVGVTSLQTEPGVITMYVMADKENPCVITILETYANQIQLL